MSCDVIQKRYKTHQRVSNMFIFCRIYSSEVLKNTAYKYYYKVLFQV